jgi:hypothetical protein
MKKKPEWHFDEERSILWSEWIDEHEVSCRTEIPLDKADVLLLKDILDAIARNTYSGIGDHISRRVLSAYAKHYRRSAA